MQKHKYLLTYRYAEIIHDLTVDFCKRYILSPLSGLSNLRGRPDYRQADQMQQAARSGKQNIVEGVSGSETSKSGEIKLLGVSKASFEELLSDFEDFLRQNGFQIYPKNDPRVDAFRALAYRLSNLSNLNPLGDLIGKGELTGNPEEDANFLLTLCHQVTYLLDKQIKAALIKFEKEGGINEKLYKLRKRGREW